MNIAHPVPVRNGLRLVGSSPRVEMTSTTFDGIRTCRQWRTYSTAISISTKKARLGHSERTECRRHRVSCEGRVRNNYFVSWVNHSANWIMLPRLRKVIEGHICCASERKHHAMAESKAHKSRLYPTNPALSHPRSSGPSPLPFPNTPSTLPTNTSQPEHIEGLLRSCMIRQLS